MINAVYAKCQNVEYAGNPLIEAIPVFDRVQMAALLTQLPVYSQDERQHSVEDRERYLLRLNRFFIPLEQHINFGISLFNLILDGYVGRNPLTREARLVSQRAYEADIAGEIPLDRPEFHEVTRGAALIGIPGVGKSALVGRLLSRLPPAIYHPTHGFTQVVWAKVDSITDDSRQTWARGLIDAISDAAESNFADALSSRITTDGLIVEVAKYCRAYHIGLLVIEEIQHAIKAGKIDVGLISRLTGLSNKAGVPVLLIGTPKARRLLGPNVRQARRNTGPATYDLSRLRKGYDFEPFMQVLFNFQWTDHQSALTSELVDVFYDCTQGIQDLVIKLFQVSQLNAMLYHRPVLTPELVEQSFSRHFREITAAINVLRSGNAKEIAKIDDLELPELDGLLSAVHASKSSALQPDIEAPARGTDEKPASVVALPAQPQPNEPSDIATIQSATKAASGSASTETVKAKPPIPFDENDIRGVVLKLPRGDSAHAALKRSGFIRDLDWLLHGS